MAPLVLALAMAVGPTEHGRLVLSIATGEGWASDPFVGAGLGGGPVLELAPGARLDLSLAPRVKLAFGADLAWLRYTEARFDTFAGRAGVEGRLLGRRADLLLSLTGDRAQYSRPMPFADLALAPAVTSTGAVALTPGIRVRTGPVTLRAAAGACYRLSRETSPGEEVAERALALDAGVEWPAHERLTVNAEVRHDRVSSARADFARVATGGEAAVTAIAREQGPLELAFVAQADRVRFDTGVAETLARLALEATHPLGPLTAVLAWSWTWSDAERVGTASRQLVYAGVRGRAGALSW